MDSMDYVLILGVICWVCVIIGVASDALAEEPPNDKND